jgi:hypothetical protein
LKTWYCCILEESHREDWRLFSRLVDVDNSTVREEVLRDEGVLMSETEKILFSMIF